jgi:general secretion pathway protein I
LVVEGSSVRKNKPEKSGQLKRQGLKITRLYLQQAGFTLIEVLVAVTILAVAMGALIASGSGFVRDTAQLRDRYIASWVAQNRIAEIRIAKKWPATGEQSGLELMAGNQWEWRTQVEATQDQDMRKLTVQVFSSKDPHAAYLAVIDAYLSRGK